MIYVSCKFTKTCEMMHQTVRALIKAYEKFFELGFEYFLEEESKYTNLPFLEKMTLLSKYFEQVFF